VFIEYFREKWGSIEAGGTPRRYNIPKLIEEKEGVELCKDFTLNEVEEVVRALSGDKAPGPEGNILGRC